MVRGKTVKAVTKKVAPKTSKKTKKVVSESEEEAADVDFNSLKVTELKALLKERSLSTAGSKADLIARLKGGEDAEDSEEAPAPKKAKGKSKAKKPVKVESEDEESEEPAPKKKTVKKPVKVESEEDEESEDPAPKKKVTKVVKKSTKKVEVSEEEDVSEEPAPKKKGAKAKPVESSDEEHSEEPAPKKKVAKKAKVVEESDEEPSEETAPKKSKAKKVKFEAEKPKKAKSKVVESESEENVESDEDDEPLSLPSGVVVPDATYNVPAQQLFEAIFQANEESSDTEGMFKVLAGLLEKFGGTSKAAHQTVKPKADKAPKKTPTKEKSPAKKPLEVTFNDKLQVYVDASETWAFDSTTGSVFARVEADELTPLDEDDLVELDKMRLKNHGSLEDDDIASIVSQIVAPQSTGKDADADAADVSEGGDDGKDVSGDDANVVEEEIADAEMDISEETFVAYKVAQRAAANPADFVAIADAAEIDEAQSQYIMLHDKSLSNKYSQALSSATAKKGVPPKAQGTRADAPGKPRRRLINKE